MGRFNLFDRPPTGVVPGLAECTEPDADEPVRAVIDLALIGGDGDGKTELAATLIRTLRARAPELGEAEAADNRRALQAVMAGSAAETDGDPPAEADRVAHYTFRIPAVSLLEMLSGPSQVGLLLSSGRARVPWIGAAFLIAAAVGAAINLSLPLAIAPPLAAVALIIALTVRSIRAAREQVVRAGDVEVVLWDPPGHLFESERAAELYDLWAQLSRRRRLNQPGWRAYSFVPILVTNPLRLGRASRLRGLLPMFAALAGRRPRAVVAINRWQLVRGACPPGSSKSERAAVRVAGADDAVELDRAALTSSCIEAEDGRDGGLSIVHVRYDSDDAAVDERDDEYLYDPGSGGALLEGGSRRAMAQLLAELALDGPDPIAGTAAGTAAGTSTAPVAMPAAAPAAAPAPAVAPEDERPTAVYPVQPAPVPHDDGYDYRDNEYVPVPQDLSPYQPRGNTASQTLAAMTAALEGRR